MENVITLNRSWLQGSYPGIGAEIHTGIPYVAFGDFYAQGDQADLIMDEIMQIWDSAPYFSVERAITVWMNIYL